MKEQSKMAGYINNTETLANLAFWEKIRIPERQRLQYLLTVAVKNATERLPWNEETRALVQDIVDSLADISASMWDVGGTEENASSESKAA